MTAYTIGQLAASAGVPTSTVRYYERAGLVKPDFRTGGNYRGYSAATLKRLKFIRFAQATGLSLGDIESLLDLTFSTDQPCDEVLALVRRRLDEIRAKITELRHVERTLTKSLKECCKGDGPDLCDDICRLKGSDPARCRPGLPPSIRVSKKIEMNAKTPRTPRKKRQEENQESEELETGGD